MLNLGEVNNYCRFGMGKAITFYATDMEIFEVIQNSLPEKFAPYCFLCYNRDFAQPYYESSILDFIRERHKGATEFFIISRLATPDFKLFENKEDELDYLKYLSFNGFIQLLHGRVVNGITDRSAVMCIDRYAKLVNPDKVYSNNEYLEIFKILSKKVKKILKYRSKLIWLDGRVTISKNMEISEGFAEGLKSGALKAKIEIAD